MKSVIVDFLLEYGDALCTLGVAAIVRWLEKRKLKRKIDVLEHRIGDK